MAKGSKTKLPTYENSINESYMILTFVFIIIAIQVSVPEIKSRKNFPGCIKSFTGYPIFNDNNSGLVYIACVAHKMRSSAEPWNAISRLKPEGIVRRIEDNIKKLIFNKYQRKGLKIVNDKFKRNEKRFRKGWPK